MKISIPMSIYDLSPGMILAKDIYLNKTKILSEGCTLTNSSIDKIKNFLNESHVYIYDDNHSYEADSESIRNSEEYKTTEKLLNELSKESENFFFNVKLNSKIDFNQVRSMSDTLLSSLKHTGLVIKNINDNKNNEDYQFRHLVNVSIWSSLMGKWLHLSERDIMLLIFSGFLHDIGKSKIPEQILNKKSKLTREEQDIMKTHCSKGYSLVKAIPFLDSSVSQATLFHHERIDGSGYPLRLTGDKTPLFAKIVGIIDIFDSMTSNRCYKEKICALDALNSLKLDYIGKLDISLVDTFVKNMCDYLTGESALLSNDESCKLIKIDPLDVIHPLVSVKDTFIDLKQTKDLKILDIL